MTATPPLEPGESVLEESEDYRVCIGVKWDKVVMRRGFIRGDSGWPSEPAWTSAIPLPEFRALLAWAEREGIKP